MERFGGGEDMLGAAYINYEFFWLKKKEGRERQWGKALKKVWH